MTITTMTDKNALKLMQSVSPGYLAIFMDTLGLPHEQRVRVVIKHQAQQQPVNLDSDQAAYHAKHGVTRT
jgi:hypothetical protein